MELDGLVTRDELEESSALHSITQNNLETINDYPSLMNVRVHTSTEHHKKPGIYSVNALTRITSDPNKIVTSMGQSMSGKVKHELHSHKNLQL